MRDCVGMASPDNVMVIELSGIQLRDQSGDLKLRARLPLNCTTRSPITN